MQLTPRYLVNNVITIIASEVGITTEYKKVYTRQLKVYRGIDNRLQFRLVNADQKPISVTNYTPKFVAFDESGKQVIKHDGVLNYLDDSSAARGMFTVNITENDLYDIPRQYLRYNIYLTDSSNNRTLTYSDSHFDNNSTIFVDDYAFPGPSDTYNVTTFTQDGSVWYSESISAEPAINGNEALHTAAIYTNNYTGTVITQATLENTISAGTNWANLITSTFTGSETAPVPVNFNGVFSYIRFKASANPTTAISKILVRN